MKFTSSQSYYSINRAYHSTTGWLNIFNILGYKDSISKLTGHTRSHHSMRILKYVVCQLAHIGIHKLEVKTAPSWSWPTHLHLMPMVKMGEAIPSVGHMPSWRAEWGLWTKTNQPTTHGPKLDRPVLNTIQKRQEYFRSWNPTFRRPLRLVLIRYYFKWIYLQGLKRNWFTKFLSRTYIIWLSWKEWYGKNHFPFRCHRLHWTVAVALQTCIFRIYPVRISAWSTAVISDSFPVIASLLRPCSTWKYA